MHDGHMLEDRGSIICNDNFTRRCLDLSWNKSVSISWLFHINSALSLVLTILSIPFGPRLVLIASLTAFAAFIFDLLTSSGLSCVLNALCCLGTPPIGATEAGTGPLAVDMIGIGYD